MPTRDTCPNHDCYKCGVRMTSRECLTCTDAKGRPIRVRFCAECDGGAIVIDDPKTVQTFKEKVDEFWSRPRVFVHRDIEGEHTDEDCWCRPIEDLGVRPIQEILDEANACDG